MARPCGITDFRYDILKAASPWNKGAAYVFVEYVEKMKLIKINRKVDRDRLCNGFATWIRSLRREYQGARNPKAPREFKRKENNKRARKTTVR